MKTKIKWKSTKLQTQVTYCDNELFITSTDIQALVEWCSSNFSVHCARCLRKPINDNMWCKHTIFKYKISRMKWRNILINNKYLFGCASCCFLNHIAKFDIRMIILVASYWWVVIRFIHLISLVLIFINTVKLWLYTSIFVYSVIIIQIKLLINVNVIL